jgi:hypothetical protein
VFFRQLKFATGENPMLLFGIMLTIAVIGLLAIEFGQAARPREVSVWNDDLERRLLQRRSSPFDW